MTENISEKLILGDNEINLLSEYKSNDEIKPFCEVLLFSRNTNSTNSSSTKTEYQNGFEKLKLAFLEMDANIGIIMFANNNVWIFSDKTCDINPLMFKLANGFIYNGKITEYFDLHQINCSLGKNK